MDAAIAVSKINADELKNLGYKHIVQIPLLMDTETLVHRPWDDAIVIDNADIFTLLFVGRIAPTNAKKI